MSYTYTKHSWEDKPSSNTPITAAKLNEIEEGIYQANTNKVDKVSGKQLSTNDFSNQDVTDLAEAKKNSHTHSNKSVLDSITNVKVNNWDNKVDKVRGKGLSENDFTSTLKSNYDNAVTNSHTHTNITVLDNFSESDGQLLYSGESISGKTEIDDTQSSTDTTYSSSKIEELIGAGGGGGGTPNALTKEVVTELPSYENAKDNVLYLIEDTTTPVPAEGIIDDENVSSTKTYSSQKITDLLDNKVDDTNFTAHTTNNDIHVTADKKTSWDNAVTNSHTHNNKSVLDKFSESSNGNLLYDGSSIGGGGSSVDAYTKSETDNLLLNKVDKISGKGLSTNDLTNTLKSNYDTAYNNSHTHSNKSTLDSITSTKVSNWDNASTNSHTHSNKTVLDGITAEKLSNLDNAISSGGWNISCTLLWANSSTAPSSFSESTVTLSDKYTNYDFIEILFVNKLSSGYYLVSTGKIHKSITQTKIEYLDKSSINFEKTNSYININLKTYSRDFSKSIDSITFNNCSQKYSFAQLNLSNLSSSSAGSNSSTYNSYLIPYQVLGYKL